jgi:hypothetical protein
MLTWVVGGLIKGLSHSLGLASNGEEKLEFWGELVFSVESV